MGCLHDVPQGIQIMLLSELPLANDVKIAGLQEWLMNSIASEKDLKPCDTLPEEIKTHSFPLTEIERQQPKCKGLLNNLYEFKSEKQKIACQKGQTEKLFYDIKDQFVLKNRDKFLKSTKDLINGRNQTFEETIN